MGDPEGPVVSCLLLPEVLIGCPCCAAWPGAGGDMGHLLPHCPLKPSPRWQAKLPKAAFVSVTWRPGQLCPETLKAFAC